MNSRLFRALFLLIVSVAATAIAQERVLHFPPDRSLGELKIVGEPYEEPKYLGGGISRRWSDVGEAKGDVQVPADARVGLFVSGTECPDLSPLVNLEPGQIESLSISIERGEVKPGDACLTSISKMEGLRHLSLSNAGVTATGLGMLAELTSLERLSIREHLDEAAAAQIAKIKSLRSLYIEDLTPISGEVIKKVESGNRGFFSTGMPISSEILCQLASLPSLEELRMWYAQPDALACLQEFASLRVLSLMWGCGAEGMRQLKDMSALISLDIKDLTDEELAALPDMPKLKTLKICGKGYMWTAAGFANLSRFSKLENLTIGGHYDGEAFEAMPILPSLKSLGLFLPIMNYNVPLTDAALEHISKFRSLESLACWVGHFTDDGFKHLAELPDLKWLHMPNSSVTDAGLAHLGKCRKLEYLAVGVTEVTDAGVARLEELSQLKGLELCWRGGPKITEEAVARLHERIPGLTVNKQPPH